MYKRLVTLALAAALTACSQEPKDKTAELLKLKKEKAEIDRKIAEIEKGTGKVDTAAAGIPIVALTAVQPTTFRHYLEVQGKVESDQNIVLTPKVPGIILTQVLVQRGQNVTAGQVLATQDPGALIQQMSQTKTQLDLARTMFRKQENLWKQQIGTEVAYLQAKGQVEALEAAYSALQTQLGNFQLRAPFAGTVDDMNMRAGEIPVPGQSYIRIINYGKTRVVANVSENHAGKIRPGSEAIISFPDLGTEMKTSVRTAGNVIDPLTRTFLVEFAPTGGATSLRPNMVAVARINDYTNLSVITLSQNAVQRDENGTFVYVAVPKGKETIAQKRRVTVGQNFGGQIEIMNGLQPGDKVITTGYQNVADGQPVKL